MAEYDVSSRRLDKWIIPIVMDQKKTIKMTKLLTVLLVKVFTINRILNILHCNSGARIHYKNKTKHQMVSHKKYIAPEANKKYR